MGSNTKTTKKTPHRFQPEHGHGQLVLTMFEIPRIGVQVSAVQHRSQVQVQRET